MVRFRPIQALACPPEATTQIRHCCLACIPYCHHERWDGTGFPHRLKDKQIPLVARIFAVVDVRDALTSPRPYREALSEAQARQYVQEQSGLHFDPDVVKNFLNMRF